MSDLSCDQLHELGAELALDLLAGRERALALAHLNRCAACRDHVRSLTVVGDRLLGVVPGVEPPVGFEDRVLARLGLAQAPARRRPRWLPLAVAAAAVALVFGLGGWALGSLAHPAATVAAEPAAPAAPEVALRVATLHGAGQRQVGQVFTYQGSPAWLYMTVSTGGGNATVSCQLARRGGGYVPMGSFPLVNGQGSWGGQLPVDPGTVTGARLVSAGGAVLAEATFDGSSWRTYESPGH